MATQDISDAIQSTADSVTEQPNPALSTGNGADLSFDESKDTADTNNNDSERTNTSATPALSNLSSSDSCNDAKIIGEPSGDSNNLDPPSGAVRPDSVVDVVQDARDLTSDQSGAGSTTVIPVADNAQASLAAMLDQVAQMRGELQRVLAQMSPGDTERHNATLNQLHGALTSCASTVPESALPNVGATTSPQPEQEEEEEATRSFIDTLPLGPVENMIRFFSSHPLIVEWPKHITPRNAEMLYLDKGIMGDAFRRRCNDVEISTGMTSSRYGEVLLNPREENADTKEVFKVAGSSIVKLAYYGDRDENPAPHMISWIEPYRTYCNAVVHLTLHRVHARRLKDILESRSGKWESITLDSYTSSRGHLYEVARYCKGLRKLVISPGMNAPELLWVNVGPTLEELEIPLPTKPAPPGHSRTSLKYVQEHCKALKRVIMPKEYLPSEVDTLLKSLGDQLEFAKANFGKMQYTQIIAIAGHCPNATFELSGLVKMDVIAALQFRVPTMKFLKPFLDPAPDNFFEQYTTIHTLSIGMTDADAGWFLSSFLREPKPQLAEVSISGTQENPAEILDLLSKISTLTKFKLFCRDMPIAGLEGLVKANKKLNKLTLKARSPEMRVIRQVLRICKDCEELAELRIGKLTSSAPPPRSGSSDTVSAATAFEIARTADECLPFRRRNTFVQILGVDYVY